MKRFQHLSIIAISMVFLATSSASAPTAEAATPPPNLPTSEELAAARPKTPPPTPPPSETPDSAPLMEHLKLLSEFLELSPEKLENIRKTILVIEGLDEAERTRLRENLKRAQLDLENTGDKIGDLAAELSPPEVKTFKRYWLSLAPPQRKTIEVELAGLDKEGKAEALRQHITAFAKQEARWLKAFRSKSSRPRSPID